jgi:trehalose 6-phosphate synthase
MDRPTRPLVIASNRGPVSFVLDEEGTPVARRGAGGLVTALSGTLQSTGGLWIAAAMTDEDRRQAERSPQGRLEALTEDHKDNLRYLAVPADTFDRYYNLVSNRVLWFVHHYLWDLPRSPSFGTEFARAWQDYVSVNELFAGALAEEGGAGDRAPVYLVQDYHLSLVPRMLRERRPDALISHFSHTPFAGPDYLRVLPTTIREALLRGLLGADVLGFHDEAWAEGFMLCCRHLPGARVDLRRRVVELDGHRALVRIYPIAIDAHELRRQAADPEVRRIRRELARRQGDARLVLRVDRLELSKNILRGFLAFEELLARQPALRGGVRFLALLNPSREDIPEYRTYAEECVATAERINGELGTPEWTPIELSIRDDFQRAVAAYGLYDVLVVNPVIDGMNLVAMEGPAVNRRSGVLVLSREAGAFSRLGRHALGVNPFDIRETADAMARAMSMPEDERAHRAAALRRAVTASTPERWVHNQLRDLERVAATRGIA